MNSFHPTHWLAALALVGAGCTRDADMTLQERTVTSISAVSGGRAVSADAKLVLDFPAGALASDGEITIKTRREVTVPELGSLVYDLGPDGLTLAKPVSIAIAIDADRSGAFVIANLDDARPVALGGSTWDAETRTARGALTHFSLWGAVTLYQPCAGKVCGDACTLCDPANAACVEPTPEAKRCDVNGQCLDAQTVACTTAPDAGDAGGAPLGGECHVDGDCAGSAKCLYWSAGCNVAGRCEAACPRVFDACWGCTVHCGCDGRTFDGCADRPYAHRGVCPGDDPWDGTVPSWADATVGPDASDALDGGEGPGDR
ncbi:hypothetical protein L6R52_30580 [Myxococcota bacterium]|nr:hypothetical protein [Myxococcota bacterium]